MIRIDLDPAKLDDQYPAEVGIAADAEPAVRALVEALVEQGRFASDPARRAEREAEVAEVRARFMANLTESEARHVRLLTALDDGAGDPLAPRSCDHSAREEACAGLLSGLRSLPSLGSSRSEERRPPAFPRSRSSVGRTERRRRLRASTWAGRQRSGRPVPMERGDLARTNRGQRDPPDRLRTLAEERRCSARQCQIDPRGRRRIERTQRQRIKSRTRTRHVGAGTTSRT